MRKDKRWNDGKKESNSLNVWSSSKCRDKVVPKRSKPKNLLRNYVKVLLTRSKSRLTTTLRCAD